MTQRDVIHVCHSMLTRKMCGLFRHLLRLKKRIFSLTFKKNEFGVFLEGLLMRFGE